MKELALHIMDLIQNSIAAESTKIEVSVKVTNDDEMLVLRVEDDGCGMDEEERKNAEDPFHTSRTTGKIGRGLPLFKEAALRTGGGFALESDKGKGTAVTGVFINQSIARQPLGALGNVVFLTLLSNEKLILNVMLSSGRGTYFFESRNFEERMKRNGLEHMEIAFQAEALLEEQMKQIFQDILPEMGGVLYGAERSSAVN